MFFRILALFIIVIFIAYSASKSKQKYEFKKEIHILDGSVEFDYKKEYEDIDSRIHELSKEIYFLRGQIREAEKRKSTWLINPKRSGAILGLGYMLDFVNSSSGREVKIDNINMAFFLRLGYLKYFNNNFGIRAELFGIEPVPISNKQPQIFFGSRFSFMHDIEVFGSDSFGLFLGFGFGLSVFNSDIKVGGVPHIGVAYTIHNKHRIEIERIFLLSNNKLDYKNSYMLSYSFIF